MDSHANPLIDAPPGAPLACLDHRAFVLFTWRLPVPEDAGAEAMRRAADAVHHALTSGPPGAAQGPWQTVGRDESRKALHQDLLPVIDQILHGGPIPDDPTLYHGHPALRLRPDLLADVHLLSFGEAAQRRLARAGVRSPDAAVRVDGATLYTFPTGLVIVAVGLRFSDPLSWARTVPAALALEALYALGHAADRGSLLATVDIDVRATLGDIAPGERVVLDAGAAFGARRWRSDDGEPTSGPLRPRRLLRIGAASVAAGVEATRRTLVFERGEPRSLVDIVGDWVAPQGKAPLWPAHSADHGRLFTFFAGCYEGRLASDALPELAYRMSRRFGADYQPAPGAVAGAVLSTFENVCHAVSTQGAAVAVRDNGAPFIGGFVESAITPTYLPMAVVSCHEYMHLLRLTQGAARRVHEAKPKEDKDRLQWLRMALVEFRLYLRFSHISDIGHHNDVYAAWRRGLDLDRMLQDLTLDVREGEQVLARLHEEDEAHRAAFWRRWASVGLATASIYPLLHIVEAGVGLVHPHGWSLRIPDPVKPQANGSIAFADLARLQLVRDAASGLEIGIVIGAVCLGIAIGAFAYRSGAKGGGH